MITIKTSTLIQEKIKTTSGTETETAVSHVHMHSGMELKLNITEI
jgi:hypothetical protein